jgi:hypothetical protein
MYNEHSGRPVIVVVVCGLALDGHVCMALAVGPSGARMFEVCPLHLGWGRAVQSVCASRRERPAPVPLYSPSASPSEDERIMASAWAQ